MKTFLCCLYNSSTGHHSQPIPFETKEQAATTFVNEISAPNSELFNIKDSLSIFAIGRYEHTSGKLYPYLFKKLLLKGTEITVPQPVTPKGE